MSFLCLTKTNFSLNIYNITVNDVQYSHKFVKRNCHFVIIFELILKWKSLNISRNKKNNLAPNQILIINMINK